jgi:hypothetical protein
MTNGHTADLRTALESLRGMIAGHGRDWGRSASDAWVYGILVGWNDGDRPDDEPDAWTTLAQRHGWSRGTVAQLQRLHQAVTHALAGEEPVTRPAPVVATEADLGVALHGLLHRDGIQEPGHGADSATCGTCTRIVAALAPSLYPAYGRTLQALLLGIQATDQRGDYPTRNRLILRAVAAAQACGYQAGLAMDPEPGDAAYPLVAYIDLPSAGQTSWHLPLYPAEWDRHATDEKYRRIARFLQATPATTVRG